MLDIDFLRSLGIREALLPSRLDPREVPTASDEQVLPIAGDNGIPAELLSLSTDELERLFKRQHTQEDPYVFLMPSGMHKFAVYPEETLGKYDLEFTAQEFMTFIVLNGNERVNCYQTGDGQWFYMYPNPSQEIMDAASFVSSDVREPVI